MPFIMTDVSTGETGNNAVDGSSGEWNSAPALTRYAEWRRKESRQAMISMAGKAIRKWWALFALPTFAAFIIGFVIPFIMGVY